MSDRKAAQDLTNLLRKKSSRKKKVAIKLEKDFDMKKFKDRIFNELTSFIG